jgi:NAD(P)-dependent dehydrogenase (short-subunit alcohol dehydrogenase family)
MQIQNSSVLITGGSEGLGKALAKTLASAGAQVVITARHKEGVDAAVKEIRDAGGRCDGIVADIGEKTAIYGIAGEAAALAGPIDILIHNASSLGPVPLRLLLDTECEDFERVLQVNVLGPFRLQKIIAGAMALRGRGLVISISSDAAVEAYSGWGAYGASKAALDHLNRIWAAEVGETGVRFLSVDPGEMNTKMHADALPDADPATLADPNDVARRIVSLIERVEELPNGGRV